MSKLGLKLKPISSEEDFVSFIRQISTDTILKCIYELSRIFYKDGVDPKTLTKMAKIYDATIHENKTIKIIVQPWQFADLAYLSIKYCNDYRGREQLNENEFYCTLSEVNSFLNFESKKVVSGLKNKRDIYLYLCGFSGEQFKYQKPAQVYYNMIREMYIVFEVSKRCNSFIETPNIIKQEIGVEWKTFIKLLFDIYIDSLLHESVLESLDNIEFESDDERNDCRKIIEYYSSSYDEIRNCELKRQIFYTKPFVKTQKSGILSVSVFFNSFLVEHAPYWIIRNHFSNLGVRDFTSEFGKWFEEYFRELMSYFKIDFIKIPESDKKPRADWKFNVGGYIFLVEQKSSTVSINVKQQETDLESYKKSIKSTIYKALCQLSATEKDLKIEKPIKFILCYDDYYDPNLLSYVFEEKCPVQNDGRYFLVSIIELEMLFSLAATDVILFNKVIDEMLSRSARDSREGIALIDIMRKFGFSNNDYWLNPIFDDYKKLLYDAKDKHKIFKQFENSEFDT